MQENIMQFFETVGVSSSAPETFPELITWFVYIFVSVMLILGVFHVIGNIINTFFSIRR